jgi:hypothetical protein
LLQILKRRDILLSLSGLTRMLIPMKNKVFALLLSVGIIFLFLLLSGCTSASAPVVAETTAPVATPSATPAVSSCGGAMNVSLSLYTPDSSGISSKIPAWTIGKAGTVQLTALNGVPPYHWKLAAGQQLPSGLILSDSGLISGTIPASASVSAAKNAAFTVIVTDSDKTPSCEEKTLVMAIREATSTTTAPGSAATVEMPTPSASKFPPDIPGVTIPVPTTISSSQTINPQGTPVILPFPTPTVTTPTPAPTPSGYSVRVTYTGHKTYSGYWSSGNTMTGKIQGTSSQTVSVPNPSGFLFVEISQDPETDSNGQPLFNPMTIQIFRDGTTLKSYTTKSATDAATLNLPL